jgi:hypothetical protein
MAKKKEESAGIVSVAAMPSPQPRLTVDVSKSVELPTVGDRVTISCTGEVVQVSKDSHPWVEKLKSVRSVTIEYEQDAVEVAPAAESSKEKHGGFTRDAIDAMSEERKAKLKKDHPDVWRWFLGGEYKE